MDYIVFKSKVLISLWIGFLLVLHFQSCKEDDLLESENNIEMSDKLSDYSIFQGDQSNLIPVDGYEPYEVSTQLFSDYAEKQRLIKIPGGSKIIASDDGLPDFPEGTFLVKTFYYFNDKRDVSKGKKIIE